MTGAGREERERDFGAEEMIRGSSAHDYGERERERDRDFLFAGSKRKFDSCY